MVEIKAIINLEDVHLAQAMNYVEAYNLEIGLLINFGAKEPSVQTSTQQQNQAIKLISNNQGSDANGRK
jgi:GxxExxY protein